ncbi:hypothetical protein CFAM422_008055 [Trichoderma lentiforme]|uniref:Uncharacterized protein n=1 Tax=Trichoderma lentiforme TaxID=1567552 RepID=A0A9P4XDM1_9HYPO|nr:hypothetical protein CFAM422_008055 [Trichoderma lentiforme]
MCARKVVTRGPALGLPSPSRRDGAAPRGTWRIWKFPAVDSGVREWGGKFGRNSKYSNAKTRNQTEKKIPAQNCCFAEKVGTERPRRPASQSRGQMGGTVPLGRDPVARTVTAGFRSDSTACGFLEERDKKKKMRKEE